MLYWGYFFGRRPPEPACGGARMLHDRFQKMHPRVLCLYFAGVLLVSMLTLHPVFLGVSLAAALGTHVLLRGGRATGRMLCGILPAMLLIVGMNLLFQHAGVTLLWYLPNGNPVTREAILYGTATAGMFAATVLWAACYQEVVTAEKFWDLLRGKLPAFSQLWVLALRFVPRFHRRMRRVAAAQAQIGRGTEAGSPRLRLQNGARVFSIAMTWALEDGIVTADSMRSRGYGAGPRSRFFRYRWSGRERAMFWGLLLLLGSVLAAALCGAMRAVYYPAIRFAVSPMLYVGGACYGAFCAFPLLLAGRERIRWRKLRFEN